MLDVLRKTIAGVSPGYANVGGISTIGRLAIVAINVLLGVTFALSIVGMAFSFFLYVMSRGDKDAVKKAQTSLTWSVIVLVLCFFVMALRKLFFALLGVSADFNNETFQWW